MSDYEHVVNGEVTERVTTVDGSTEDTRIGIAALDRAPGADGWRVAGTVDPEPEPVEQADPLADEKKPPAPAAPAPKPKPNPKD